LDFEHSVPAFCHHKGDFGIGNRIPFVCDDLSTNERCQGQDFQLHESGLICGHFNGCDVGSYQVVDDGENSVFAGNKVFESEPTIFVGEGASSALGQPSACTRQLFWDCVNGHPTDRLTFLVHQLPFNQSARLKHQPNFRTLAALNFDRFAP